LRVTSRGLGDVYKRQGQLVGYSSIENKHINYNERFLRQ
jgi:hypothetical protein